MRDVQAFRKEVMTYWRTHGRHNLPWRQTRDPYAILVSEIMLQQTQVDRVIPYFETWMRTFPTVKVLARSDLATVLRLWSGLGYNRRAKMLHECAKTIMEKQGGRVPKDSAALQALPGIGPYTAGAIRAFAFDEPDVFIETNIRAALLHHYFPRSKNVPDTKLTPILRECLEYAPSPRDWYSALMDYGAHIKKTNPNPSRRSKHHTRQSKFDGSLRQARGAIVLASVRGAVHLKQIRKESGISAALLAQAHRDLIREGMLPCV